MRSTSAFSSALALAQSWAAAPVGKNHAIGATVIPAANDDAPAVTLNRIDAPEALSARRTHEFASVATAAIPIPTAVAVPIPASRWRAIPIPTLVALPAWRSVIVVTTIILRHRGRGHQLHRGNPNQGDARESYQSFQHSLTPIFVHRTG